MKLTRLAVLAALLLGMGMSTGGGMSSAAAQDALAGKRLYFDAGRIRGAGTSCVDCHFELPGAFAIGSAANDPARVQRAIETIPQMTMFRGRLSQTDYADLAAYLGRPDVPSAILRASTSGALSDRIEFGSQPAGSGAATGQFRLANTGQLALGFTSGPRIVGAQAADYVITASNCSGPLAPGGNCVIDIRFSPPPGAAGDRRAALQIEHDWIGGQAAVALLGQAQAMGNAAATPIGSGDGGGGALAAGSGGLAGLFGLLGLLVALLAARVVRGPPRSR